MIQIFSISGSNFLIAVAKFFKTMPSEKTSAEKHRLKKHQLKKHRLKNIV